MSLKTSYTSSETTNLDSMYHNPCGLCQRPWSPSLYFGCPHCRLTAIRAAQKEDDANA